MVDCELTHFAWIACSGLILIIFPIVDRILTGSNKMGKLYQIIQYFSHFFAWIAMIVLAD